ncbi:MAG: hypothetical protein WBP72_13730 [Rhodocyclaceae bacterium]
MLSIKEGMFRGKPVSLFQLGAYDGPIGAHVVALNGRMDERFRCGDSPRPGHTPLVGEVAFIKTKASDAPAALIALGHQLSSLFSVVFVQSGPDAFVATVVNARSSSGISLGEVVSLTALREHEGPWSGL